MNGLLGIIQGHPHCSQERLITLVIFVVGLLFILVFASSRQNRLLVQLRLEIVGMDRESVARVPTRNNGERDA